MSGQKCAGEVSYGGSWGRYRACKHDGTLEHDGKLWCKIHHPPTAKAKRDAKYDAHTAKWQADRAAAKELARRADCFPELLEALRPFGAYLDALEKMGSTTPKSGVLYGLSYSGGEREITVEDFKAARAATTKAENKETR